MKKSFTLCWDCKKATGGCTWSDELIPVNEWVAVEHNPTSSKPYLTYSVVSCPNFERDAYEGGSVKKQRIVGL